ncbi:MAG: TetR/AcrR family transcriptional regulator [Acidimicrobiales bacterium]
MSDISEEVDGRRLRRGQNREAVIDALLELFRTGDYQPGSHVIADRAGLSPRSLFRYFDDIDDLHHAAIDRQLAAARPLLDVGVGPDAPLEERIDRIVNARVRLFETIAPAARAGRVSAHRHPVVSRQIHDSRSYLRQQLTTLFEAELGGGRRSLLPAIDALCSFETHELLRVDQRLSRTTAVSVLVDALHALLDPPGGTP